MGCWGEETTSGVAVDQRFQSKADGTTAELKLALQWPPGSLGCASAWAQDELTGGDAKHAAEISLLSVP